jgi:hypothetical protein
MNTNKLLATGKFLAKGLLIGAVVCTVIVTAVYNCHPDVAVKHGDNIVASTVCGMMYVADPTDATRADFQLLLQNTREVCKEELGTEESWRNEDGSLKHAVLINESSCVINWELCQVAALKAYEEVCMNKKK